MCAGPRRSAGRCCRARRWRSRGCSRSAARLGLGSGSARTTLRSPNRSAHVTDEKGDRTLARRVALGASVSLAQISGRTFAADHLGAGTGRELAAVVHQEAARAGELVGLPRQHPQGELFVGQIRARQLERLGEIRLVAFEDAALPVCPARLQFFKTVFAKVFVNLARGVVIGRHGSLRCSSSSVVLVPWCSAELRGTPGGRSASCGAECNAQLPLVVPALERRLLRILAALGSRPAEAGEIPTITPSRP